MARAVRMDTTDLEKSRQAAVEKGLTFQVIEEAHEGVNGLEHPEIQVSGDDEAVADYLAEGGYGPGEYSEDKRWLRRGATIILETSHD